MGVTPHYALRYPEPTGAVTTGATNLRQLAEDVEARMAPAFFQTERASAPGQALGATAPVVWGATEDTAGGFFVDGAEVKWGGPAPRLFLVSTVLHITDPDGVEDVVDVNASLYVGGPIRAHGTLGGNTPGVGSFGLGGTITLTWAGVIGVGAGVRVDVTSLHPAILQHQTLTIAKLA